MIYSLRGTLIHCEPTIAVVECGGVGYMCLIPLSTYTRLTPVGSEIMLFTYMNVRQDAVDLFGFSTREEMNTFKLLTTVSGVGAKAGLAILSELTPEAVTLAIVGGDEKSFTRCAGIGKKIAARIVLELRDKFKGVDLSGAVSRKDSNSFDAVGGSAMAEAVAALMTLGYSQSEAASALVGIEPSLSCEDMIKIGLKALAMR